MAATRFNLILSTDFIVHERFDVLIYDTVGSFRVLRYHYVFSQLSSSNNRQAGHFVSKWAELPTTGSAGRFLVRILVLKRHTPSTNVLSSYSNLFHFFLQVSPTDPLY